MKTRKKLPKLRKIDYTKKNTVTKLAIHLKKEN